MNALRDEALRMNRPEISRVVHVGWVIASFTDDDGTNADPKTETIAAIVGCSDETVARAKKVLKALGVLAEKRRPNANSAYRLQFTNLGDLDWDAHMHLYTDTPQARRKKRIKEQEIAEHVAKREEELTGRRTPSRNGVRNPFPPGVPDGEEGSGTRSATGSGPRAERGPDPVSDREETAGPALAPVPAPAGRPRRPAGAAAASTQPPLLLAVPGQDPLTTGTIRPTPPGSPHSRHGPTELSVPCGYCEAPAGARCRNTVGLRGTAHQARLEAWTLAHTGCPDCRAPADNPCTGPDGIPHTGIHPARAELGARMRATAAQQQDRHTGT